MPEINLLNTQASGGKGRQMTAIKPFLLRAEDTESMGTTLTTQLTTTSAASYVYVILGMAVTGVNYTTTDSFDIAITGNINGTYYVAASRTVMITGNSGDYTAIINTANNPIFLSYEGMSGFPLSSSISIAVRATSSGGYYNPSIWGYRIEGA